MQLKKSLRAFIPPPVTYIRSGEHKSKKDARRLGDEEKANIVFNCASCQRWAVCHDSKKSVMYKCSRYREAVIDGSSIEELLSMENLELEFDRMNSVREEDFNFTAQDEETIEEMIAKVISSNVPVPPDLRIDDREIPLAKNLMEWLFDSRFGQQSQPPFPRQIEIGSRLFGDICPRCSDMDWLDTMPVDTPIGKIRDKLTFLNYGRCPKCKVTRGELYLAEEIENYYGIIGLAGQRCVTGDTLVTTTHGFKYMKDLIHPSYKVGFNEFKYPETPRKGRYEYFAVGLENGYVEKPSDFYISDKDRTIKVITDLGFEIEGSFDHPVMTQRGWVKLKNITDKDSLRIQVGQNVWSSVDEVDSDTAKFLGYVVSEGHLVYSKSGKLQRIRITNSDSHVLNFCARQARKLGYTARIIHHDTRTSEVALEGLLHEDQKQLVKLFGTKKYRSANKHIPQCILSSTKQVVASFLRGLFEGDGCVSTGRVSYTTLSSKLAKEVQILLANFGIFSKKISMIAYASNVPDHQGVTAFKIEINGRDSLHLFQQDLGFDSARKQNLLQDAISRIKSMPYLTDTLDVSLQEDILHLFESIQNGVSLYKPRGGSMQCTLRSLGLRLDRLGKEHQLSKINALSTIEKIIGWEHFDLIPPYLVGKLYEFQTILSDNSYYSPVTKIILSKKDKVTYDFTVPNAHRFMANGILNHNSAKTTSAILWSNYNLHRMLKLPSPQAVFATQDTQVISYTYTALTFNQAVANVWNPYLNALRTLPWFKNYHEFLRRKSNQLGEELFNLGEHLVRYRHRNLILNPSGPNKRTMRGQTRMEGLVDEPGWYIMNLKSGKGDPERLDANGVFTALNNSLLTLKNSHRRKIEEGYYDLPKPLMFATSSPSSYNDFIMTAYRIYRTSREFYAYKYETWNFNPLLKKKDFAEEFRTKPVEAARDYECNPPIGEGLFIPKVAPLAKAFNHGQNKFSTITHKARSSTGVKMTSSEIRLTTNRFPSYGTVLSIDLGLVNNSLSFSIVGLPDDYDSSLLPEDRETLLTPVQVFAVGEIIPHLDTKISLTDFYTKCIIPLIEPFNILYLISDRWNSAKIGQDLEAEYEVTPIEHKASWEDFENTRDLLYSGNLLLPKTQRTLQENMEVTLDNYPEVFRGMPIDHLQWQFMTVKEQTNVTVIKGDGTDDSFRTVVLGVHAVQDDEIREALLEGRQARAVEAKPVTSLTARMKGQSSGTTVKTGSDGNALSYLGRRR